MRVALPISMSKGTASIPSKLALNFNFLYFLGNFSAKVMLKRIFSLEFLLKTKQSFIQLKEIFTNNTHSFVKGKLIVNTLLPLQSIWLCK